MAQLSPYLFFSGNCREAMEFYKDCIGGELSIQTVGESPAAAHMPSESHGSVMHSQLKKDDFVLMASEMMDRGEQAKNGNVISLCIIGKTKGEIEPIFAKLSEGADVHSPLKEEFFGTFGALKDKYGINWMFQYSSENN